MPNANRPTGPGKPLNEQHDAVEQQEGLDELEAERSGDAEADAGGADPGLNARHAERAAHTKRDADSQR